MNEFGLREMQMRTPHRIKNGWVFEVLDSNTVQEIMAHGDMNDDDLTKLAESGRTFLVFHEAHPGTWYDWFNGTRWWADKLDPGTWYLNVAEFTEFAAIVIGSNDIQFRDYRSMRKYA
jgi:hypothetical protein